nr:hypothetical protein 11 [bacterium]
MLTPLKAERMKRGYRQWVVAQQIGISEQDLSRYEIGRRECPPEIRVKLARFLDVSEDVLFPGVAHEAQAEEKV